jgi:FkbM family methyltransferase
VRHLDYFAFYENSNLDLPQVRFWGGFKKEFNNNKKKFLWVESLLADDESRNTYERIIRFRLSGNLEYMKVFTDRQQYQYFENFLDLDNDNEVFVDVGGYDGFTSEEFIKRCPGYRAVYIFEPDFKNIIVARNRLKKYANVHLMQIGLSSHKETLRFSPGGSVSAIDEDGDIEIQVDALDKLVDDAVTFIKMDIEGAESKAIEGARNTILKKHPGLAICVYHKDEDLWKIPKQVLSIRDDYKVYLRHYTEGVTETVMFFVPR